MERLRFKAFLEEFEGLKQLTSEFCGQPCVTRDWAMDDNRFIDDIIVRRLDDSVINSTPSRVKNNVDPLEALYTGGKELGGDIFSVYYSYESADSGVTQNNFNHFFVRPQILWYHENSFTHISDTGISLCDAFDVINSDWRNPHIINVFRVIYGSCYDSPEKKDKRISEQNRLPVDAVTDDFGENRSVVRYPRFKTDDDVLIVIYKPEKDFDLKMFVKKRIETWRGVAVR
jgi:hypothetical protein